MFRGDSQPALLVQRQRRSDSLHLSKHSLAVTLSRTRPSFFTQTDRVCHRTGPAGEIPQLDAAEKTNQALKLSPLPRPRCLLCRSELPVAVGEAAGALGSSWLQQRHQLLLRSGPRSSSCCSSWALLSDPNPRFEMSPK